MLTDLDRLSMLLGLLKDSLSVIPWDLFKPSYCRWIWCTRLLHAPNLSLFTFGQDSPLVPLLSVPLPPPLLFSPFIPTRHVLTTVPLIRFTNLQFQLDHSEPQEIIYLALHSKILQCKIGHLKCDVLPRYSKQLFAHRILVFLILCHHFNS